ncbi:S-adenosyl-L-methionine-dependent methyltransferase [Mucor mucedo]|uniref:S-adenosyl-L-methionine-dependent methyltransferase n=1 Tax=Mucor mucedo TaxID=29922 RepID=UPI00222035F0|nr:S-adenosyl-L-methionine-dependent methyltransferase [Mucor mucedo]KAI7891977.1 S-adenosyl-L-methionine-dependent methyltransferase [Mucor mucedo]
MANSTWEKKISSMINESKDCVADNTCQIEDMTIYLHPNVYSPKYFPESKWFGKNLRSVVEGTKTFLEVGLGSGIISLYMARLGLEVTGVDINPDAVETTKKNFEINHQKGHFETFDPGYKLVERYIAEGGNHLTENGSLLLGSCCYANIDMLKEIGAKHHYDAQIKVTGKETIGDNVEETYYIIEYVKK